MFPSSTETQRRKRELRLRIGRLRRQIDRRIGNARRERQRLVSWRTVVRRMPGNAVLGAFGLGLALAAGLSARSIGRWIGLRMLRHSLRAGRNVLWNELRRAWTDSSPRSAAAREAARHD